MTLRNPLPDQEMMSLDQVMNDGDISMWRQLGVSS